jgi:hypothetical protein
MPATALTPTKRFIRPGVTKFYWVTTMANYLTPTRLELDAGKDWSAELASISGFAVKSENKEAPDMGSDFVSSVIGMTKADDSSVTLYLSSDDVDVRDDVDRGDAGYAVIMDAGDVTGYKMDIFPARISGMPQDRDLENVATVTIEFAITRRPATGVAIPS